MTAPSIRRTLLWLLLAMLTITWVASAVLTYRHSHREIDALLDAHLRQSAHLLMTQPVREAEELYFRERHEDDEEHRLDRYGTGVAFQVRTRDGQLLQRSSNAPHAPFSSATHGFESVHRRDRTWRVYSAATEHGDRIVQVAENHATRERIARRIALRALEPLAIALPLLGLAIGWVVRRALRPLDTLGAEIARRGGNDLAPVTPGPVPAELAPLVRRLDELFLRIRESLDSERRFTSHAAHELRTPVAALRAQAEVAATARDPAVREAAQAHCIEACDRMTRLVSQLLVLARADEIDALEHVQPCRIGDIAQQAMAELTPDATRAHVTLELDDDGDCAIRGDPALLAVVVRNLVDNAIGHGRSEVQVGVRQDRGFVVLEVVDDGPGVPDEALSQLGRRFYRAPGAQGVGSGLGLSIVGRIVELHHGQVNFVNKGNCSGFVATVTVPSAQSIEGAA